MSNQSSEQRITQKLSNTPKKKSQTNITLVIVSIIIVSVIVVALILFFTQQAKPNQRNAVVTPDNVEEILSDMQNQKTSSGTYEVTMNTTWNFDKGDSASRDAYVGNSTANANDVYFDVVRSDTKETILSSPTIPVGSHLENITLDKTLEAGSHNCVLTYHLLDDNGDTVSTLNINVIINVED